MRRERPPVRHRPSLHRACPGGPNTAFFREHLADECDNRINCVIIVPAIASTRPAVEVVPHGRPFGHATAGSSPDCRPAFRVRRSDAKGALHEVRPLVVLSADPAGLRGLRRGPGGLLRFGGPVGCGRPAQLPPRHHRQPRALPLHLVQHRHLGHPRGRRRVPGGDQHDPGPVPEPRDHEVRRRQRPLQPRAQLAQQLRLLQLRRRSVHRLSPSLSVRRELQRLPGQPALRRLRLRLHRLRAGRERRGRRLGHAQPGGQQRRPGHLGDLGRAQGRRGAGDVLHGRALRRRRERRAGPTPPA